MSEAALDDPGDAFLRACQEADRRHVLRSGLAAKQLRLLAERSRDLAERVRCCDIEFIDAVDMAWSAAVGCGLVDFVGADAVQAVLAAAFGEIPCSLREAWQQ